jgi:hypothetical protein
MNVNQCNICIVGKIRVRFAEFHDKDSLLRHIHAVTQVYVLC